MAHRTPGPLHTAGTLLRALTGLALLTALVAGTPIALLALGHQPTELTGGWDLLLQQDDGTLFLVVLTLLGWAAWAAFTGAAALEIASLARRRSAPRIRGLGGFQTLASFLLGGIVLLAPTAASAATSSPAIAITQTATPAAETPAATPATSTPSSQTALPTHEVTSATETPWGLAQEYLHDGRRWKDIAALNPDVPQLASGDEYLPQGTLLTLPADARPPAVSPAPEADPDQPVAGDRQPHSEHADAPGHEQSDPESAEQHADLTNVTVHEGDSLWKIADRYGEPTDWPAIYQENKGEAQPGGRTFDDPSLIYPGQNLDLPPSPAPDTPPPGAGQDHHRPPAHPHHPQPSKHGHDTPDHEHAQGSGHHTPPPTTPTTQAPTDRPHAPHETPPAQPADEQPSSDTTVLAPAMWTGTGIVAAALVATLAIRRRRQQNRRRPGRRIAMPEGRAATTEQSLRHAQAAPTGFDLLNTSLRCLAINLSAASRDLPALDAVVLQEHRIELHLTEDTEPAAPFTAAAGRQDLWTCPANHPALADDALPTADAPYPALVSIGWDPQGRYVLIDLEHIGILNLAGDPDAARHVLQALAVELANTPIAGHLDITTLGQALHGLDTAVPERVARAQDVTAATTTLAQDTAARRQALADLDLTSTRAARLHDDTGGDWTPHVLLAHQLPDEAATQDLLTTLAEQPLTASAVVTTGPTTAVPAGAWTLHCQGPDDTVVLPGSGLPVRLQTLSDEHFADAIGLLTTADSDSDMPAPAWTITEEPHGHGDDLPDEYTELEKEALTETTAEDKPQVLEQDASGPSLADILAEDTSPGSDDPTPSTALNPVGVTSAPAADARRPVAVHATIPSPTSESEQTPPQQPVEDDEPTGPTVLLLGPVKVDDATGRVDSNRKSVATELTAYLALHPGVDHHAIDAALWPASRVNKTMRNSVISRTRSWLATDHEGNHHFPRVQDTDDKRYRLGPHVTCDWHVFQRHARTGLADHGEDGDLALRRALALLRGRPFAGIDPQRYAWAEPTIQEMVSAIVDVAYELSTRRREADDANGALWAARQGLLAVEESETLHRAVFLAHHATGDIDALRQAAARLRKINDAIGGGVEMEADTTELLRNLLPRPARTR